MGSFLLVLFGIFFFGLLIAVHEFGHFITAKLCGVRVNEFAVGMGPALLSKQGRETLYSLRLFPIGGYCAMEGEEEDTDDPRSFMKATTWKKLIILIAGAFMNFLVGFLLFFALCAMAGNVSTAVVASYLPGFAPQESVRLLPGDRILAVDGHAIFVSRDVAFFFGRGGDRMDLVVERDGARVALPGCYMPYYEVNGTMKRGISLEVREMTPTVALREGWFNSIDTVRMVWLSLGDLFSGAIGLRDMSGPVGIVDMMGQVAQQSPDPYSAFANILYLIAFIAVNLAVMNLLPIPALDGGRVFFLLINLGYTALTRRTLDPKYEGAVNTVCFIALLGLMVVVAASDILKLFGR